MKRVSLKAARKRARLTQDELAARSGIDQTTISALETGRNSNPTLSTVLALSSALGVDPLALKFAPPVEQASA